MTSMSNTISIYTIRGTYRDRPSQNPVPTHHGRYMAWVSEAIRAFSRDPEAAAQEYLGDYYDDVGIVDGKVTDVTAILPENYNEQGSIKLKTIACASSIFDAISFIPSRDYLERKLTYYIEKRTENPGFGFIKPYPQYSNEIYPYRLDPADLEFETLYQKDIKEQPEEYRDILESFLQDPLTDSIGLFKRGQDPLYFQKSAIPESAAADAADRKTDE